MLLFYCIDFANTSIKENIDTFQHFELALTPNHIRNMLHFIDDTKALSAPRYPKGTSALPLLQIVNGMDKEVIMAAGKTYPIPTHLTCDFGISDAHKKPPAPSIVFSSNASDLIDSIAYLMHTLQHLGTMRYMRTYQPKPSKFFRFLQSLFN